MGDWQPILEEDAFVVFHYKFFVGMTIQMGVRSEFCVTRKILGNNFGGNQKLSESFYVLTNEFKIPN